MLPECLQNAINAKIDEGDSYLNVDQFEQAERSYREAIQQIPDPKYVHAIALPAFTALGEALFFSGDCHRARQPFLEALKAPGGLENPLLHLRLGQAYFDCGDLHKALDSFLRAYALEGKDIFDNEDEKYLAFLKSHIAV